MRARSFTSGPLLSSSMATRPEGRWIPCSNCALSSYTSIFSFRALGLGPMALYPSDTCLFPELWGSCPSEQWEHPSPGYWSIPGNLNLFRNAQKWECLQHHRARQCQGDYQAMLSARCMHVLWWRYWVFCLLGWAEGSEELESCLNVWRGDSWFLGTISSYFPMSHPVERTELYFRSERETIY